VLVLQLAARALHQRPPEKNKPMPHGLALQCTYQVLSAVDCLHDKDLMHRDVKPSNVLQLSDTSAYHHVALCDLGLARIKPSGTSRQPTLKVGTRSYRAPELLDDDLAKLLGPEPWLMTDVWATGAMLLALLRGRRGQAVACICAGVVTFDSHGML
jgi:serine/threonine-protein kinase